MDGGAWWAAVHGVAKSRARLSDFTFTFHFHALEEEMATHSSVLAWRIPGTEEPGRRPSMGSHKIDCLDLLAVQGTLKSLLQHHSSKASILWHLAFFMVQLSHPYMTTGKTAALTIQNFVSSEGAVWWFKAGRKVLSALNGIQAPPLTSSLT